MSRAVQGSPVTTTVRGALTREELADFLEDRDIPVRIACRTPSGHLWMLSLWYRFLHGDEESEPWLLECSTAADATVVDYLKRDDGSATDPEAEVAFEVSTNRPPYRGVRGRGTASVAPDPEKEVLRDLLEQYLGGTDSQLARTLLREERDEVTIAIEPAVVYGWDYSDRMGNPE
ncbi:pyridoxamine 5'-phosphate oxidase family protein [Natronobacterium lacisalsi]|uniref:pyridoxamine 5'-phosphate oxidase family protein n=1 Tax=Natronobacterium lacisalsi TaxID=229731 RepID=UPI00187D8B01